MTPALKDPPVGIVHVVDDDDAMRLALTRLLGALGYEVRAHATAAAYLLEPDSNQPSCLILDVNMPDVNGLEIQEALARKGVAVPIIFLTGHGDIPMSVRAMRAGASDFLTKPVARDQLLAAVSVALATQAERDSERAQKAELVTRYESLTAREREVFDGVVAGKLNKQIAAELDIAERTVKAHRSQVMEKMQAPSVADLVRQSELLIKKAPGSTR
jgi:FixJ family two-component response regulator